VTLCSSLVPPSSFEMSVATTSNSSSQTVAASLSRRVVLNCAGTVSQVSLALLQQHPLTRLAQLTAHCIHAPPATLLTSNAEIFLDRDPASFNVILNWYRYGKCIVPPHVPYELVADDIVYFKLPVVIDARKHAEMGDMAAINPSTQGSPNLSGVAQADLRHLQSYPLTSMSRANSHFVEAREYPAQNDDTATPASPLRSSAAVPSLSHMPSFALPTGGVAAGNYAGMDDGDISTASFSPTVVNILPPTPPILTPAASATNPPTPAAAMPSTRPSLAPLLVHQQSGSIVHGCSLTSPSYTVPRSMSPRPAAVAANYLSLGASDMDANAAGVGDGLPIFPPHAARAASAAVATSIEHTQRQQPSGTTVGQAQANLASPNAQPALTKSFTTPSASNLVPITTTASPASSLTAASAATVASVAYTAAAAPPAAAASPSVPLSPPPRVPFDLAIEMLSCFKDINRAQALALLDGGSASDVAGGSSVAEGSYLFRYCADANEKDAAGNLNKNLFVLSYKRDRLMYNTKIFRLYIGEQNALGASTTRGYILSEHKEPTRKEHTHARLDAITMSIIGAHARALP
jgi:hypothetical protein